MRFEYADARMPVAMVRAGVRYYLGYDQVGTLKVVANASGNIVKQIGYDTFGCKIEDTNPAFTVPFGFAGGLYDRDTGLVRFGFRDYDPETGRWTAKDPIGFACGDTDLYWYCLNDPVNFIDTFGLDRYSDTVTVATSVLDVGVGYANPPTTPAGAILFTLSILADKANAIVAFTPDSNSKAIISTVLSVIGTGTALAANSPLAILLSSYGLGTTINGFPVYGTDQTLGDWWVDFLWDILHDQGEVTPC